MNTHMNYIKYIALFIILTITLSACETVNQDEYQEYIIIESYAVAGESYPNITIRRTVEVSEEYVEEMTAVRNAIVKLSRLDDSGEPDEFFEYIPSENNPGLYGPGSYRNKIEEGRTYRFEIDVPGMDELITAETTVPKQFQIVNEIPEQIVYQSDNQLEIILTNSPDQNGQKVFVFSSTALEPAIENLTPFYQATVEDDDEQSFEDFVITSSGLINQGNFNINPDQTITLRFPWIGVSFYGHSEIITYSVDKNTSDLVRSQSVQLGGSTLSPGEIPNLIYNIDGAIGVFGSVATDTITTEFVRPF